MLTLQLEDNAEVEKLIFGDIADGGTRVLLYDGATPVGVAVFTLSDNAVCLERIGILESVRGSHYGDFFTRAMLFKLAQGGLDIIIPYFDNYYIAFGFETLSDNTMHVKAANLVFPSSCGGK